MSGPHSDTMSGFYKQLSQEQANEIHALKTQIAGFSAQITSLTAQVAAQKDQICLLEQDPGRSSGTASQDRQAVKLENERGIPAEDPGQPRPLAAALKPEDLNPAIPIQAVVDPASRAFALSGTDVAIPTLSGAPFLKKERLGGGSTDGAERAQSGSQLAKLKEVSSVIRSMKKRARPSLEDATTHRSSKRIRQSTPPAQFPPLASSLVTFDYDEILERFLASSRWMLE